MRPGNSGRTLRCMTSNMRGDRRRPRGRAARPPGSACSAGGHRARRGAARPVQPGPARGGPRGAVRAPRSSRCRDARALSRGSGRCGSTARTGSCTAPTAARCRYDTLVLATGSNPVLPPLRGLFCPGRHELPGRRAPVPHDGRLPGLSAAVRPGIRAVVIGGGLLGCLGGPRAGRARRAGGARPAGRAADGTPARPGRAAALVRRHLERARRGGAHRVPGARRALRRRRGPLGRAGRRLRPRRRPRGAGLRGHPRVGLAQDAGLAVAHGRRRRRRAAHLATRTSGPSATAPSTTAGCTAWRARPRTGRRPRRLLAPADQGQGRYTGTRALTRLTLAAPARAPAPSPSAVPVLSTSPPSASHPAPRRRRRPLADATRGTYRKVVVRDDRLVGGVLARRLGTVGALARAWEGEEPLPADRPCSTCSPTMEAPDDRHPGPPPRSCSSATAWSASASSKRSPSAA